MPAAAKKVEFSGSPSTTKIIAETKTQVNFGTCRWLCTAEWHRIITVDQVSTVPTELTQPALKINYTRKLSPQNRLATTDTIQVFPCFWVKRLSSLLDCSQSRAQELLL